MTWAKVGIPQHSCGEKVRHRPPLKNMFLTGRILAHSHYMVIFTSFGNAYDSQNSLVSLKDQIEEILSVSSGRTQCVLQLAFLEKWKPQEIARPFK